jgi:hypothetical protein
MDKRKNKSISMRHEAGRSRSGPALVDSVEATDLARAKWRLRKVRWVAGNEVIWTGEAAIRAVRTPSSSASTVDDTDGEKENTDEERQRAGSDICPYVRRCFPRAYETTAKNLILDIASRSATWHYKMHPEELFELRNDDPLHINIHEFMQLVRVI